jgi:GDP-L-fucose synthase
MEKHSKIYIAGHRGMVGSAIVRKLQADGYSNLMYRTSKELDLRNQQAVADFFSTEKPEYVFMAAATVGGIHANNTYRADFIYENLMIECNVTHQAYKNGVSKMLFLGSSCIYPKLAEQPLKEEYLLNGFLEYTNEPYAIAKIAGIKLCENYRLQYGCNFISAMPTNLYGPNDNYDLNNSHVLPALVRKFATAKKENKPQTEIWGSGSPLREFLYVDDLAEACLFLMENYNDPLHLNIGSGQEITIKDLALLIKEIVGYKGEIVFNAAMPDGTPRKLLDCTRITQLGWKATTSLRQGIENVVKQTADLF